MQENILRIKTRTAWRNWLMKNFNEGKEVWLVFPKKTSGEKRIQYNDAVEEALCFGWIDSTQRTLDSNHTIQRFTPRKSKCNYSQANKERLRWLSEKKMIHPSLEESLQEIIKSEFVFPPDIINALKKDKTAWGNYESFSESYKRIRIAYIDGARNRPDEFKKRLSSFIERTRDNKLIKGFGGIDKYYQTK